jgi:phosphotransferase system enzyme I (PtsI)
LRSFERSARRTGTADEERGALADALAFAQQALEALSGRSADDEAATILAFQLALLEDEEITRPSYAHIAAGEPAHDAWRKVLDPLIEDYEAAEDHYFRGRASDLCDLRDRVLDALLGGGEQTIPRAF